MRLQKKTAALAVTIMSITGVAMMQPPAAAAAGCSGKRVASVPVKWANASSKSVGTLHVYRQSRTLCGMVMSKGGGNQWMSIYLADGLKQSKDKITAGSPRPSKAYWNRGWDAADAGKFQKYAGPVRDYDNGNAQIKANIKRNGVWHVAYWRG